MGTSKNVASPDSHSWKPVRAVLGRTDISITRQATELWRSAMADRGSRLVDDLSQPALASACALAARASNIHEALRAYDNEIVGPKAGFAIELARRALARAVVNSTGGQGFACELFAEATSYYASRDLPSYVCGRGRVETISSAVDLKNNLKLLTEKIVTGAGAPSPTPSKWERYVRNVVSRLEGEV